MTLCAVVFTPEAMVACEAAGHRWATVRAWGGTCWRECTRCGQTGPTLTVVAENDAMAVAMPACDVSEPPSLPLCERPVTARRGRPSVDTSARDTEIRSRHAAGETVDQLSAAFGLHRSRIGQIARGWSALRHGRAVRRLNVERNGEIRRRAAAGEQHHKLALEFGLTDARISQIIREVAP